MVNRKNDPIDLQIRIFKLLAPTQENGKIFNPRLAKYQIVDKLNAKIENEPTEIKKYLSDKNIEPALKYLEMAGIIKREQDDYLLTPECISLLPETKNLYSSLTTSADFIYHLSSVFMKLNEYEILGIMAIVAQDQKIYDRIKNLHLRSLRRSLSIIITHLNSKDLDKEYIFRKVLQICCPTEYPQENNIEKTLNSLNNEPSFE